VSSQKDAEEADIEKERLEQLKGPEARQRELDELAGIYVAVRGAAAQRGGRAAVALLCVLHDWGQHVATVWLCLLFTDRLPVTAL
jgi:hypothetical protein